MTFSAPDTWQRYRLGQVFSERKEKGSDSEYPPVSVTKTGIVPQLENAAKTYDGDNRKIIRVGDYAINSRSDRKGSGGISNFEGSTSQITIVLEPLSILPQFAHHLLRSTAFQEEFYRWGHGIVADLWTTKYSDMKNIRIAIPDLKIQYEIANFLDRETARIDVLIKKKERLVELYQEYVTSLTVAAVTGKNDIKTDKRTHVQSRTYKTRSGGSGFVGGNRIMPPLFSSIPQNWDRSQIKRIISMSKNGAWGDEMGANEIDVICVRVADFNWSRLTVDLTKPTLRSFTNEQVQQLKLETGDILIEKSGGGDKTPVGRVVHFKGDLLAVTSNFVARIRVKSNFSNRFVLYLLAAHYLSGFSFQFIKQNTGIQNLDESNLFQTVVWTPGLEIQNEIAEFLDNELARIGTLKESINASITLLRERRAALITAAVTGQIDIKTYKKTGQVERQLDYLQKEVEQ